MIKISINLKYNHDNIADAFFAIKLLSDFINNTDDLFIEDLHTKVLEDNEED